LYDDAKKTLFLRPCRKRKRHLVAKLQAASIKAENKARFIMAVVAREVDLTLRRADIVRTLKSMGFACLDGGGSDAMVGAGAGAGAGARASTSTSAPAPASYAGGYDYLLSMALSSLNMEQVAKLKQDADSKRLELEAIGSMTPETMWLRDLAELRACLQKELKDESAADAMGVGNATTKTASAGGKKAAPTAAKKRVAKAAARAEDDAPPSGKPTETAVRKKRKTI
jgi:hypothetical protein